MLNRAQLSRRAITPRFARTTAVKELMEALTEEQAADRWLALQVRLSDAWLGVLEGYMREEVERITGAPLRRLQGFLATFGIESSGGWLLTARALDHVFQVQEDYLLVNLNIPNETSDRAWSGDRHEPASA